MALFSQSVAFEDDKIWVKRAFKHGTIQAKRGFWRWQDLGKAGPLNMARIKQSVAFEDDKIWVKRGL